MHTGLAVLRMLVRTEDFPPVNRAAKARAPAAGPCRHSFADHGVGEQPQPGAGRRFLYLFCAQASLLPTVASARAAIRGRAPRGHLVESSASFQHRSCGDTRQRAFLGFSAACSERAYLFRLPWFSFFAFHLVQLRVVFKLATCLVLQREGTQSLKVP